METLEARKPACQLVGRLTESDGGQVGGCCASLLTPLSPASRPSSRVGEIFTSPKDEPIADEKFH